MNACKKLKIVLGLIGLILLPASSIQAQTIKLLRESPIEVGLIDNNTVIDLPVTINSEAKDVTVVLTDVTYDNPSRSVSLDPFSIGIQKDSIKGWMLKLRIKAHLSLNQGKYHLLIAILKPAHTPIETFSIDLNLKAATLAPFATIVRTRIQHIPFWGSFEITDPTITLFETSRNAKVTPLTVRTLSIVDRNGNSHYGAIKFTEAYTTIIAGRQAELKYSIDEDLPVGTTTGTFELYAPQLQAPVPFTMEVITKRGGWWIVLIIIIGLVTSYITKTLLAIKLQLNEARRDLLDLITLLELENSRRTDNQFNTTISTLKSQLEVVFSNSKAAEINKIVVQVRDTDLPTAIKEYNTRFATLSNKVQELITDVSGAWSLPEKIAIIVRDAASTYESVQALLTQHRRDEADKKLNKFTNLLPDRLSSAVNDVTAEFKALYDDLTSSSLKPLFDLPPLSEKLNELKEGSVKMEAPASESETTGAFLKKVSDQRRKSNTFLYDLYSAIGSLISGLDKSLRNGGINNLSSDLERIRKEVATILPDTSQKGLDKAMGAVKESLNKVADSLISTLTNGLPNLTDGQKTAIKKNFDEGKYSEAVDEMIKAKPPVNNQELAPHRPDGKTNVESYFQVSFPGLNRQLKDEIIKPRSGIEQVDPLTFKEERYNRIVKTIFFTSLVQTILVGIGITLFGYTLFAEKFVGTPTDMIEIFSWAYLLDLSVSTLGQVAGTIPKKIINHA